MGDLTAIASDARMLELSLQPTKYARGNGQTLYAWGYKRLLFGQGCHSLFILHFTVFRTLSGQKPSRENMEKLLGITKRTHRP